MPYVSRAGGVSGATNRPGLQVSDNRVSTWGESVFGRADIRKTRAEASSGSTLLVVTRACFTYISSSKYTFKPDESDTGADQHLDCRSLSLRAIYNETWSWHVY